MAAQSATPLLKVEGLKQYFKVNKNFTVKAVDDVSFEIYPGETYGLVGESGSGKSTIGRSIIRLYDPTAGKITFDGQDISGRLSHAQNNTLRTQMQMIFQDPMASLNPRKKVEDIIGEGLDIHHMYKTQDERREKVEKILEKVGLAPEHAERYPHQFSGGQRQRVGIARALIMNPKLIIADEPTTALDVTVQAQILELLKKLTKEKGTSVIMITHDLGVVASMCDRIAIMYAGQIVEEGTVDEIFYEPHHPYTKGLLNSINNSAKDNDEPLVPIPGTPPDLLKLPKGCAFMSRCPYTMKICEVQASPVTTYSETHCCRCWLECMDETKITVSGEEAALEDSRAGSHFYPDFAAVLLKQKVAEQYGLKAENVLTGAGSSAMIDMIGLTFLDDGDEVLFSAPTYGHLPIWHT